MCRHGAWRPGQNAVVTGVAQETVRCTQSRCSRIVEHKQTTVRSLRLTREEEHPRTILCGASECRRQGALGEKSRIGRLI